MFDSFFFWNNVLCLDFFSDKNINHFVLFLNVQNNVVLSTQTQTIYQSIFYLKNREYNLAVFPLNSDFFQHLATPEAIMRPGS